MNCDLCGKEIGLDATIDTHNVGPSGRFSSNKTHRLTMCPGCAASRQATVRMIWWTFAALVGGLILHGMLSNFVLK